jgi:hypothetical protein
MNNIHNLIDEMESYFDTCGKVPITGKLMVDMDVIYEFLTDLRLKLPEEIKRAERIVNEKEKIIYEAKHAAQSAEKEAAGKVNELINDHEIMQQARMDADQLVTDARNTADEIKFGAYEYIDEIIAQLEIAVKDTSEQTHTHYKRFETYMGKQIEALEVNRQELDNRRTGKIR